MAAPMEVPVRKEDKCGLCGLGYGDLDSANGSDEISVLLPCGHVYGNICIQARRQARNYSQACPGCQKSLLYQGCGHEVKALHVTAAQRHEGVRGEGVPYRCIECAVKDFEVRNQLPQLLAGLARGKERYKTLEERDNAAGVISNERVWLNVEVENAQSRLAEIERQSRKLLETRGRGIW